MAGTIGIIQARMGSSRLPAKILAPLAGRPVLALLAARLREARVDEWWLATTSRPDDDVTTAWGHGLGLAVYRGAEADVLSRFTAIIEHRRPEWIVRVTADDPFTDSGMVNHLLDARDEVETKSVPIVESEAGLPLGYAVQVAKADAVLQASRDIPDHQPHHRSHVLSWLAASGQGVVVPLPPNWPRRPDWRWTIDTPEDLAMAGSAFELFGDIADIITYPEMVARLDPHPQISAINRDVAQKPLEEG